MTLALIVLWWIELPKEVTGDTTERSALSSAAVVLPLQALLVAMTTGSTEEDTELNDETTAPSTAPSMAPSAAPSISPLINDLCLGAIGLEGNMFISGSTKKATFDEGIATCGDIVENGRGQWYEIIGQNAQLRAHTCFGNTTSLDTQLSVYQGGTMGDSHSCSAVTCIAGNDEHNCGHGSFVQWFGYENMTY